MRWLRPMLRLKIMKRWLVLLLILQIASVVLFLHYAHQADLAMGKDGIGDVENFTILNKYAGLSFYSAMVLWVSSVVVSLVKKQFKSKEAQFAIGVAPVAIIAGWISLWFI